MGFGRERMCAQDKAPRLGVARRTECALGRSMGSWCGVWTAGWHLFPLMRGAAPAAWTIDSECGQGSGRMAQSWERAELRGWTEGKEQDGLISQQWSERFIRRTEVN